MSFNQLAFREMNSDYTTRDIFDPWCRLCLSEIRTKRQLAEE
jgi:hypothetical protein